MDTRTAPLAKTLHVDGMTCGSCARKVQQSLEALPEVVSAEVDKAADTAVVELAVPTATTYLQSALPAKYKLSESGGDSYASSYVAARNDGGASSYVAARNGGREFMQEAHRREPAERASWFITYRPLLTIIGLIALTTVLSQAPYATGFDGSLWMRHFMAGFFIVFAGFKLLDVAGFRESYRMYDVVAKRLPAWGHIYPFVELGLGLIHLTNVAPFWTNIATIVILGVSAIGVIQSVIDKRAIKCACLGTGFNLPMSTVTIIEDVGMVAMAAVMLLLNL